MKRFFDRIIPKSRLGSFILMLFIAGSLLVALFRAAPLLPPDTLFLYGMSIFFGAPFLIGMLTPLLMGYHKPLSGGESVLYSLLVLSLVGVLFLFFAIEGLLCLIMASPITIVFALIGTFVGYGLTHTSAASSETKLFGAFALFLFLTPSSMFLEGRFQNGAEPEPNPTTTTVEINAPPEIVWQNVIEFSELPPPTEALFQTGVAYPIRARIEGRGVGAVRHCIFSTGSFVEPITTWDEPNLLQFSVLEQPFALKEISLYEHLETQHINGYLVSKRGQFKLTRLTNGSTRLEGTTWYFHRIKPDFYWQMWSDYIIHTIHGRVLNHIKNESEKAVAKQLKASNKDELNNGFEFG